MGCCGLALLLRGDVLLCWECQLPVRIKKTSSEESRRCIVKYTCICGKERICDCGTEMRVKTDHGDVLITCEG